MSEYTPSTKSVQMNYCKRFQDKTIAAEWFDRWLMQVKAEAWEEGFAQGLGDGCSCDSCLKWVSNPYRGKTE